MKKIVVTIITFITLIIIGIYFWLSQNTSSISTSVSEIKSILNQSEISRDNKPSGENTPFSFTIKNGYQIKLFADLSGYGAPRVIAFDSNNNLATTLTSQGKVILLPDSDNDGTNDQVIELVSGLNKPHGLAFYESYLYVAETDKVVRYVYDDKNKKVISSEKIIDLPGGGGHFTRTIQIYDNYLFVSVGSSCNVCVESDDKRSAILRSNLDGSNLEIYAKGLRNTVFFVFDKEGRMIGNDMGRDLLGDNLPPEELNVIYPNTDYGWPWCYGEDGKVIRDLNFQGNKNVDYCLGTRGAAYTYPAHVAPLGIAVVDSQLFAREDQGKILSVFHGSWNSTDPVGYKIVILEPDTTSQTFKIKTSNDFVTGFILDSDKVLGRPVDVVFDKNGQLFISDDKANMIYRVYYSN